MFDSDLTPVPGMFRSPTGPVHPVSPDLRPVWIRLDILYPHPADAPQTSVGDGLDLIGNAPGLLSDWVRSARGMWLGRCNFAIPYADGRPQPYWVHDQLVPAYALLHRADAGSAGRPG